MQVLVIKMTSMGDVIHTLPALTDAKKQIADVEFDWVVEKGFSEIPRWHESVREVIPVNLRQWRKQPFKAIQSGEVKRFVRGLRTKRYDLIIDAQGLMKSALVARLAKGKRVGYAADCVRERFATCFYQKTYSVPWGQHAVTRIRALFAHALGYPIPESPPDYGIDRSRLISCDVGDNYFVFLHGTTWPTKHWPEEDWVQLAQMVSHEGYHVLLPWGNETERLRAENIAKKVEGATVLPKLSLSEMTSVIAHAKGVVAVDTGLGHVAAAMAVPTVSLYGPTNPGATGAYGPGQVHLCADYPCAPCLLRNCKLSHEGVPPCYASLPPQKVFDWLMRGLN